jgi:hypothetical protein
VYEQSSTVYPVFETTLLGNTCSYTKVRASFSRSDAYVHPFIPGIPRQFVHLSRPWKPSIHGVGIFLESDIIDLDNKIKTERSQCNVSDIKKQFIRSVIRNSEDRSPEIIKLLSTTGHPRFPTAVSLLDVTYLCPLESDFPFDKPFLLIRDDYGKIRDLLVNQGQGSKGSAVITGQVGIGQFGKIIQSGSSDSFFSKLKGKDHFLYWVLVERLRKTWTTFFQKGDTLYLFRHGVVTRVVTDIPSFPGPIEKDIWVLVDGFSQGQRPHPELLSHPNIRIVMTASPKDATKARDWLKKERGTNATFYMRTWTKDELFLIGCALCFLGSKASFVF